MYSGIHYKITYLSFFIYGNIFLIPYPDSNKCICEISYLVRIVFVGEKICISYYNALYMCIVLQF